MAVKTQPYFDWQSRFHDHIIRDDQSYRSIQQYIIVNPLKWKENQHTHNRNRLKPIDFRLNPG